MAHFDNVFKIQFKPFIIILLIKIICKSAPMVAKFQKKIHGGGYCPEHPVADEEGFLALSLI